MTAINLALRNRDGYVIWGNTLRLEQRLIYRTGFNLRGFVRELRLEDCPPAVQQVASEPPTVPDAGPSLPEQLGGTERDAAREVAKVQRPGMQLRFS